MGYSLQGGKESEMTEATWHVCTHVSLCDQKDHVDHQAPLSMKFPRQEYWSELPFLLPADLPNTEMEPVFLKPPALARGFSTTAPPGKSM